MAVPVVIFAFNRPNHFQRTLVALATNKLAKQSDVIIFCDGPRNDEEKRLTRAVRNLAKQAVGFRSLSVVERTTNAGLAQSVIRGVSKALTQHERIIVLEDDLVTSQYFLLYMNEALEIYADTPKVASVHGWCFPNAVQNPPETFF
jgi:GT2 family glycosyltransferase